MGFLGRRGNGRWAAGVRPCTTAAPQSKDLCDSISFGKDLLAGGVPVTSSEMAVAPVEQVKLLLQVPASSKQIRADQHYKGTVDCFLRLPREQGAAERQFQGLGDCVTQIAKTDGLFGLQKGFGVSVQGTTAYRASCFGCYDTIKSREAGCPYKGTLDCFMKIYEREGLNAFFCGAFSNTLRRTGGALALVLNDKIEDIFNLGVSESSGSD